MEIKHDIDAGRFYSTNEGKDSYLMYSLRNGTMDIYRTYVPPEQRHKGIAAKIVKAALDYAKENNLKVIPSCSYTDYFIKQNKEYKSLL